MLDTATEVPDRNPDRRYEDANGYVWLVWDGLGRAREHRVVTRAPAGTHVHHKNGIRNDNRLENLELMEPREHQALHRDEWSGSYRTLSERHCVICGDGFHPKSRYSTTCRAPECVAEHHRRAAKIGNQKRWAGKRIMTPEERLESARESRRRYKRKLRAEVQVRDVSEDVRGTEPGT